MNKDDVTNPSHYTIGIETADYIGSWDMNFYEGNVIKYVTRAPFKGTEVKDLKKAQWYLNRLIAKAEAEVDAEIEALFDTQFDTQLEFQFEDTNSGLCECHCGEKNCNGYNQ